MLLRCVLVLFFPVTIFGQSNYVTLENGEKVPGQRIRYRQASPTGRVVQIDEKVIPVEQVDHFVRFGTFYKKVYRNGVGPPKFYMSHLDGSRVDLYYKVVATGGVSPTGGFNARGTDRKYYYSVSDSVIRKLKPKNLLVDLKDNKEAIALVKKGRGFFTANALSIVAGTGLVVIGIVNFSDPNADEKTEVAPFVGAGAVCFILAYPFYSAGRKRLLNAVDIYNK